MTLIQMQEINRTYKNNGLHAEQALAFTLTGEIRKHDSKPFYADSDIPEFAMSVKSAHFTLASANIMQAQDKNGQIEEYLMRVHSTTVAYVSKDFSVAYVMTMVEFAEFLYKFTTLTAESKKHGGKMKLMARSESKAMKAWFAEKLAA